VTVVNGEPDWKKNKRSKGLSVGKGRGLRHYGPKSRTGQERGPSRVPWKGRGSPSHFWKKLLGKLGEGETCVRLRGTTAGLTM